ncbi:hypothetical protein GRX03_04570 [Halovenus sp. WSH3]|uniref:Uncharacterized protein n=1 Tax=Halovenus carboxidivorans TaxID=2692199 RepID=A0A6B0T6N4_9EURY|nr:hypothetical protein [Halovenus carboxidivorans]
MIVVATGDFELYHDAVGELQDRGVAFTTAEPAEEFPEETEVVLTGTDDDLSVAPDVDVVRAEGGNARSAVEDVIALLRGDDGRTVIGIDPGEQPGIAVLAGDMIVATFQVPPEKVADVVHDEAEGATDPLVRIGDGARLIGARIIDDIEGLPVELVDETGTTPYLGAGTRGVSDVLAAANIARMDGERIDERDVEPTGGELKRIQERSRELSEENRSIDADLARAVAVGEMTIREALDTHRD